MQYEEYQVKVYNNGDVTWYQNDKLHRTDGPAVECPDGYKAWFQNDKRHRIDGPAVEYSDGSKDWYQNGKLHRTDGPAVEYSDGTKKWFLEGKELTEQEFNARQNSCADNAEIIFNGKKYRLVEA